MCAHALRGPGLGSREGLGFGLGFRVWFRVRVWGPESEFISPRFPDIRKKAFCRKLEAVTRLAGFGLRIQGQSPSSRSPIQEILNVQSAGCLKTPGPEPYTLTTWTLASTLKLTPEDRNPKP